jgi:hypothetical protein
MSDFTFVRRIVGLAEPIGSLVDRRLGLLSSKRAAEASFQKMIEHWIGVRAEKLATLA